MRTSSSRPLAALVLSSVTACGGVAGTASGYGDAGSAPDEGVDVTVNPLSDDGGPDAIGRVDAMDGTLTLPDVDLDVACVDGSLADDGGIPIPCGPITCPSASQFCTVVAGGRIAPVPGCNPIPCSCGASPSCACLELPSYCMCSEDAGAINVFCALP